MKMWQLTLKVRDDGGVELTGLSEGVPPGEIEIHGSDDGNRVILEAKQRDEKGRFVISAHHRRDRAEEALHDLEGHAAEAIAIVAE